MPGLALFYGGLVRAKNMLSVLMQVFIGFSLIAILWVVYGYSLAFTDGGGLNTFVGGFSKLFLAGVNPGTVVETFSRGVVIPELTFVVFQLTFAAITPALIIGAIAERTKFSAVLFFIVLWFTFSYLPMAHMVWWWAGPEFAATHTADETIAISGLIWGFGALDFAGGTVVHINAGVAGLVAAIMVGPRVGYLKENMAPHNLVFTLIGACAALGRLVRLQRRLQPRGQRLRGDRGPQHHRRHRRRGPDLEPARILDPRPRQPARRCLGRCRRPRCGHACGRLLPARSARSSSASSPAPSASGRWSGSRPR